MIFLKVTTAKNAWYAIGFLIMDTNCKDSVCNGYRVFKMLGVNISDIASTTIKNVDCRCIIYNISKSKANHLLKNSALKNCGYR